MASIENVSDGLTRKQKWQLRRAYWQSVFEEIRDAFGDNPKDAFRGLLQGIGQRIAERKSPRRT